MRRIERSADAMINKEIYVITIIGAYGVGKATALDFLRQYSGHSIKKETFKILQR